MNLLLDIKYALLPEAIITMVILVCCFLTFVLRNNNQKYIYYVTTIGSLLALFSFSQIYFSQDYSALWNSFVSDSYTILFRILILIGAIIAIQMSKKYISGFGNSVGEFYVLLLTATLGAMLLSGANDLIMIFIAIETLSISSYILAGYTKLDKLSNEAALKYLIIGGASTSVMLFGFSYLYGIAGETNMLNISEYLSGYNVNLVLILSFLFILGGFAFKLAAVPFHSWAPDVYHGAPIPVAAYLSVVSKTAAFAVIIRFMSLIFGNIPILSLSVAVIAILTMTIGNLMAVNQTNIKRLMAYSSIAQAGYILAGLALFTNIGISSMIFYLITYLFMNFGTWAAIEMYVNQTGRDSIDDFNGLGYKQPLLAGGLTVCLLSLAGIPITAGFFSKFYLFQAIALAGSGFFWLLLIALINTIIAVYYYLRVIKAMYLKPKAELQLEEAVIQPSKLLNMVLGFTVSAVIILGILASPVITLTKYSASKISIPVSKVITR